MATVEENENISVMKFNDFMNDMVDVMIQDKEGNSVLLLEKDVRFAVDIMSSWLEDKDSND